MLNKNALLAGLLGVGLLVSGSAVASHEAAPTLTIKSAACKSCKWRQGWFTGSVTFSATVTDQSQLQATVRSAKTQKLVVAPRQFSVGAGTFTRSVRLSHRPLPGTYVLELTGTSGGATLPDARKTFSVPTPVEGVADRGYASATRNGPAKRVFHRPRVIYAHFHFLQRPQASKVRFTWRRPDYTIVGTVRKTYRDYFWTYVLTKGGVLTPGTWYCYLRVSGKLAKGLSVRVTS